MREKDGNKGHLTNLRRGQPTNCQQIHSRNCIRESDESTGSESGREFCTPVHGFMVSTEKVNAESVNSLN